MLGRRPDRRRVKAAAPAAAKARQRALGGEQVEGRQAVREVLLAGNRRVNEVWIAVDDGRGAGSGLHDLAELARELRVPVKEVSRNRLDGAAKSEAPQGVLARCAPLHEVDIDDLVAVSDLDSLEGLAGLLAEMAEDRSRRPDRIGVPVVHRPRSTRRRARPTGTTA